MPDSQEPTGNLSLLGQEKLSQTLDITGETCPMTFVRTRLALDRLKPGERLLVLMRGAEPLANVPRTATEQGHVVLALETGADGVSRLLLQKAGG
ncbi:sulfurtransferase TusA family protein [Humitalea sp. 24SJ18S-53]|uniref:sulfurtransferase TusA family protein n=1 Tax=Humitalea sp. 24SJ18S-53 TaxID=3422307 RepID=UPI003D67F098